jgi:hypothetical protein
LHEAQAILDRFNQGVINMSISLSYDRAAYNIAQTVKFNTDVNKSEGRLGAWKFTSSLYYVSSTEWKIVKLWYDFLVLIGAVIDQKNDKFQNIANLSSTQFNKLEQEFNKEEIAKQNATHQELTQQISKLNGDVQDHKASLTVLKGQCSDGLAQIKSVQQKAESSAAENSRLLKQIQNLTQTLQDKEKDLKDAHAQMDAQKRQMEDNIQVVSKNYDSSKKEIETLNDKFAKIQQENTKLLAEKKQKRGIQAKEIQDLKKKITELESHPKESTSTSEHIEEDKKEATASAHKDNTDLKVDPQKPQDGEISPRDKAKRSVSIGHKIQKILKNFGQGEKKETEHKTEDHSTDHTTEASEGHKPDQKTENKTENKEEHKTDHKVEHKVEFKEDQKPDLKAEVKDDHKVEHKAEIKEDQKPKEERKVKRHEKRDSVTLNVSTEAASQDH